MKLGFSTLSCPRWDLESIAANAARYGFDGVDFRGLLDEMDVTVIPEFTGRLDATLKFKDGEVRIGPVTIGRAPRLAPPKGSG